MSTRVFLTGASSGIGEALARLYGARGATLGLLARREERLRELKRTLACACEIYPCDVRDAAGLESAAADFMSRHGPPDLVIGNAGLSIGNLTEFVEDTAVFREILEINVLGLVNTFRPFIEPMRKRASGRLAGIASVAGLRGIPGATAYSASKAAAIRYLEGLRVEMRRTGVGVTTICPGYIATPMTEKNPYPMPFIITAEEFARRCARSLDSGASLAIIPWQMAIVGRILAVLPNAIYDRAFDKVGRKPRRR